MEAEKGRPAGVKGMWVVAALFLLGALFLWLLFTLTAGRRAPPPPDLRTVPGTERRENR